MNETIPKARQIKIIITFVIVAIIITCMIIFREELFKIKENIPDNEKFYTEYPLVSVDNVYKYITIQEAINIFENGTGVVLFGFKECKWCQNYVPILNELAKEHEVATIYYCDIKEDRSMNSYEYQALLKKLQEHLYDDNNGNKRLYVPDVYFIAEGKILGHNNDTSTQEGTDIEEYYNENIEELKNKLNTLFEQLPNTCIDSEKGC